MTPKEILIRATKTAIQTGIAVIVASQAGLYDAATWKAAASAAIAAALSAISNALHTSEDSVAAAALQADADIEEPEPAAARKPVAIAPTPPA